jgi:hypothetical protein
MNFAFQALVIFILVLPGIIFRRSISQAGHLRERLATADELAGSVIYAASLHLVWAVASDLSLRAVGSSLRVDIESAFFLASGQFGRDSAELLPAMRSVTAHPILVFVYFATLCVAAALLGNFGGRWPKLLNLLVEERSIRRLNDWSKHFEVNPGTPEQPIVPLLATVVVQGNVPYLYVGLLSEFIPDDNGNPDRFVLQDVVRRRLDQKEDFYEIKGDVFILRAVDCKTLNYWAVKLSVA